MTARASVLALLLAACGGGTSAPAPTTPAENPADIAAAAPDAGLAPATMLEQRLERVVLVYEEMARIAQDNEDDCALMGRLLVEHLRKHRAELDAVAEVEVTEQEMERIAAMFSARVERAMHRMHPAMTRCPEVGPMIEGLP